MTVIKLTKWRTAGLVVVALAIIYLVLVLGFGRPLGLITLNSEKSASTGATVTSRYDDWENYRLTKLVGQTVSQAKADLGSPEVDNTLAKAGGLTVVSATNKPEALKGKSDSELTITGYCIRMELADRHRLTLAAVPTSSVSSDLRARLKEDPEKAVYEYQKEARCDPETIGQAISDILVRPRNSG
ncbi:hypothetical protein GOEFS_059_00180 [Gordonia effusa NBRC 100432]|uniref:Uncharacterized protein n=1 Tax=Gordonia effusa NBRC 100432 TaxID=1077974 RepID=H0R0I3_9ACTN|nr:hypothetical protein [Gordonia effusa]GAB18584.1 hypothetical protein GOEFS_059_00180 [Gordonia effusa NBRC 100432]